MKTMKEWKGSRLDISQFLQVGDIVDDEILDYFIGVLPPACMSSRCVQIGEPTRHNAAGKPEFETLEHKDGNWIYTGVNSVPNSEKSLYYG